MTDPHPMISDGMTESFFDISDEEKPLLESIGKIVMPIFEQALQETSSNRVQLGTAAKEKYDFSIVRPHNYRRWFDFNIGTFTPPTRLSELKRRGISYKAINYGSEHFFENYMACNIKVKKQTIEIQNKIENDRAYAVDIYRSHEQMARIIQKKEYECIKVIKAFLAEFGGHTTFTLKKHKEEVKIENNAITDKLAQELTWHTDNHKKVYSKKLVELYDINKAIQLIDNSIFYRNVEEIAQPLKALLYEVQKIGSTASIEQVTPESELPMDFSEPQEYLDFNKLSEAIQTIEDGLKYKEDILALPEEDNFRLAQVLQKRFYGGDEIATRN